MLIKKGQSPILIVHSIALIIYTIIFLSRKNYEFLWYVCVIIFFMLLILFTNHKINYPNGLLWGLVTWSILHMSGGGIIVNGARLYELMILPVIGAPYHIFKFDQFVHIVGFYVATLAMYAIIKDRLNKENRWVAVSIVIVMAGLGTGALNEIIEFFATIIVGSTGVGGYENTALDLVANLIGAIGAMTYIIVKEKGK